MFKNLKDKLAEQVKSSPQRIQQFAQAAQAAVTSASSSISDITNNDLFSIGDNDSSNKPHNTNNDQSNLNEVSLLQKASNTNIETMDYHINQEMNQETQRQRRLSNSSFASDISFRLPSYESPSMYHLQSDMEVSASEAEDRGFPGGSVNLDRVTKEQLYSAYRRTQDRCTKYKTQYADLARHYKLLERENAKARNVLVETQDKALRRISELREQCSLEQSAKAHLEKALRIDIEEKSMKIETLNKTLTLLQGNSTNEGNNLNVHNKSTTDGNENDMPLITLTTENASDQKYPNEESPSAEVTILNNKIEKMDQLLNKYKESLKSYKEKNAQLTAELQIISNKLDTKIKENEQLQNTASSLSEAKKKIQELNESIEELQNKNNSNEFMKSKEMSILELNLKNAQEEIVELHKKIEVLSKREEEYAISLAENKLSIHKELEGKETEIKSLKETLADAQNEIQSFNIIISDHKSTIGQLEEQCSKLRNDINELNADKLKVGEVKAELETFAQKCQHLESLINKSDEEYKCLELQMKQENAEKLAMIDRNVYLENRNAQLIEENMKKNSQISNIEHELLLLKNNIETLKQQPQQSNEVNNYIEEINKWKLKCSNLESEIQDERVELVKLQSEIEKLLVNHESVQNLNEQLDITVCELRNENEVLKSKTADAKKVKISCDEMRTKIITLRKVIHNILEESKLLKEFVSTSVTTLNDKILLLSITAKEDFAHFVKNCNDLQKDKVSLENEVQTITEMRDTLKRELSVALKQNEKHEIKIKQLDSESTLYTDEIQNLKQQQNIYKKEVESLMLETQKLNETLCHHNNDNVMKAEEADVLKKEIEELNAALKAITIKKEKLEEEVRNTSNMYEEVLNNLELMTKDQQDVKDDNLKKTSYIIDLEKRLHEIKEENIALKNLSDTISKSVVDIELELKDVQKSHALIESEKDHLITVIDNLEKNVVESKNCNGKSSQTDLIGSVINDELSESKNTIKMLQEELQLLKEENATLSTQNKDIQVTINKSDDLLKERNFAFDKLKEDNRRLQSDIEGLQTHITKVSKENSQLNDKLRELMASVENVPEKTDNMSHDIEDFKNEIQIGKDKIDSLIRENSLLAEENLELKDQIKSQSYSKSNTTTEDNNANVDNMMEKYNALLETKNNLQKKLSDVEQMNQSVNSNMHQMQVNNDKLKVSNEKLGLRLDEALVSLRHLHSLQENTELEYLRNILYEYLTGPGIHSITLAKVLAAVVKFDDRQTELVLQKEKERQGLLRQLGII